MKRGTLLAILIGVGALSMAVSAQRGGGQPAGPTAAAKAAAKMEKVKDNLYMLTGSTPGDTFSGGNSTIFITDTGVVVVDTKLPVYGQFLLDQIKTVTNKPVTTLINTHTHGDHTGGNSAFPATIDNVVQENTKTYMARDDAFKGDNAKFL